MARPDAEPVNTPNPALQAKLSGAGDPAPTAPTVGDPPADPPAAPSPPPGADAGQEPAAPAPAAPTQEGATEGASGEAVLPEPDKPDAKSRAKWEPTGVDSLDSVGALFDEKGYDGSTALQELTQHGEISRETFDEIAEALGPTAAKLVHNQLKSAVGEMKQQAQAEAEKIFESVGGKEAWDQVAAWSKSSALSQDDRNEYNNLLKAGGKAAQLVAKELKERMMADPNFKSRADLLGSGTTPVSGGQQAPTQLMDRATYNSRIREAENRGDAKAAASLRQAGLHAKQNNPYWKIGNPK